MLLSKRIYYKTKELLLVFVLLTVIGSPVLASNIKGFYLGPAIQYASTDWGFLVTPDKLTNPAVASAPIGADDSGMDIGALIGYRFSNYFSIEGSYSYFHPTRVTLDSINFIFAKHNIYPSGDTYTFSSQTQSVTLQLKLSLPITMWGLKNLSFFTSLGPEVTIRKDMFADKSKLGGVFGGGISYDIGSKVSTQLYFNYETGYGSSTIYPVEDYIPFIYQVGTAAVFYF